ncbi:MAG: helix-turn-helix domain-containing protein [Defluviitaleaceae bacterium]|nr:helix-turn-helix domain-containing protein [Defluviitaleaceae bacterium]
MRLANIIAAKRREKGITQDELAAHAGVSKASVSKWENGLSYPDITLLPIIASYFDISIDQLMDYSPQLTQEEITKVYNKMCEDFASRPFEDVFVECEMLVKKHFSCYELVIHVVVLYINHLSLMADAARKEEVIKKIIALCGQVLNNSRDVSLLQRAAKYQAMGYLGIGDAKSVLELFADENGHPKEHGDGALVSQAHQMLGDNEKANEVEQVELIQSLVHIFNSLTQCIMLNLDNYEAAKMAYERAEALDEIFNMRRLDANVVCILHVAGSRMHHHAGQTKKTIESLEKLVDICTTDLFPYNLRGDEFFDLIDKWIAKQDQISTRSEDVTKNHILNDLLLDPAFENLHGEQDFKNLVKKFKDFMRR